MIGFLRGEVAGLSPETLLLDVGGVGYELSIPASLAADLLLEQSVRLAVHTHVREDVFSLFGFKDAAARDLFRTVLKISGVGPKVALAILSAFDSNTLVQKVKSGPSDFLSTVPGIGKKTAERIFLDLKDKLKNIVPGPDAAKVIPFSSVADETVAALVGLGYKPPQAAKAVSALTPNEGERVETFLVKALRVINA